MTTLVYIVGNQYRRYVGRVKSHGYEFAEPLSAEQIKELINDPVKFESAFDVQEEAQAEGQGGEAA